MYDKTRYSRGVLGVYYDINLETPEIGETYFHNTRGRVMTWDGEVWMCSDYIKTINRTGGTVYEGTVMLYGSSASPSDLNVQLVVSNVNYSRKVAGVVVYQSDPLGPLVIQYKGIRENVRITAYGSGITGGSPNYNYYLSSSDTGGAIVHSNLTPGVFGFQTFPPDIYNPLPTYKPALLRPRVERM